VLTLSRAAVGMLTVTVIGLVGCHRSSPVAPSNAPVANCPTIMAPVPVQGMDVSTRTTQASMCATIDGANWVASKVGPADSCGHLANGYVRCALTDAQDREISVWTYTNATGSFSMGPDPRNPAHGGTRIGSLCWWTELSDGANQPSGTLIVSAFTSTTISGSFSFVATAMSLCPGSSGTHTIVGTFKATS
jgi:hypothetical protein